MGNNIKVILRKDVPILGEEGDIKSVKAGFARNYLFPRELAVDYSPQNRNIFEKQKAAIEKRKLEKKDHAKELKDKLEATKVSISIPSGDKGRLYGTVTTALITDELVKSGFNIDKKKVELKEHIKFAGAYKISVHVYQDIYASVDLTVIAKQEEKKEENRPPRRKKRYNRFSEYEDFDTEKGAVTEDEKETK
jgi:large subunit ribosomal protein L9